MRRLVATSIALAVSVCACSITTSPSSAVTPASRLPTASGIAVTGGCGSTQAYVGGVPDWLDLAGARNNPRELPYVIADPPTAAGFLFTTPLRAGHPSNPANKILWVVGQPRNGDDLQITAHPVDATTPVIQTSQPANSSPGEIYPSIVDVPLPGCWHFELTWAGHTAAVELPYVSP